MDHLAPVLAIFGLAGIVKGVIGLGLPTVSMGLLGLFMLPAEAAALLLVPSFVTNVWQLAAGPRLRPLLARLWPLLVAIVVGTLAGSSLLAGPQARHAASYLGAALLAYAVVGLARFELRVPPAAERWAGPLAGLLTGLITGATGTFVIPGVPYLNGLALDREELIQALGLSFTVSTVALAAGLAWHGALGGGLAGASFVALAPALLGMWLGGWLRRVVSPPVFRRCFFVGLLLLGGELLFR